MTLVEMIQRNHKITAKIGLTELMRIHSFVQENIMQEEE